MPYLIVAVFNDELRAQQAMNEMIRFHRPGPDLDNALLLTWNGCDPIVQQSQNLADRSGVGWGTLWGSLLGTVIADSGEIGAAVGRLRQTSDHISEVFGSKLTSDLWIKQIQVPADFLRDIAAMITPGRSAIFFVSRSVTLETTSKVTHGYGGTILSTLLTRKQMAKIRSFLRGQNSQKWVSTGKTDLAAKVAKSNKYNKQENI